MVFFANNRKKTTKKNKNNSTRLPIFFKRVKISTKNREVARNKNAASEEKPSPKRRAFSIQSRTGGKVRADSLFN